MASSAGGEVAASVTGGGPEFLAAVPPALAVLAVALLLPLLSRRVGHALGALVTGGTVAWVALVPHGHHLETTFLGFDAVLFNVDDLSVLMGIIFAFIGATAVVYSYATDADNTQTAFALGYVGTSLGAVFAGDWLTFVFFVELMAIASTLLVWHYRGDAVRSGFRYAIWHGMGGSLVLAGIVWHYAEVGSFLFTASEGIVPGIPAALYAIGFGVNVGFIGLHVWLPDTYPAPHIAASVFMCVYTTKTGVYALGRAFPDGHLWLAYMGGGMAVFGAFMALMQNDMRRLLSYHIQSQVGYMVAGVGIGTALSYAGAFAHVYNHILYKSLLFMCAGAIIYRTDTSDLKKLGGLWREMPLTAIIFTVAALSISGFPGFNGFVSKGMVVAAAHYEHMNTLWYILLAGGVGTFASFIKFGYYAFLHGNAQQPVPGRELNAFQKASMGTVAVLCVVYGLYPDALFVLLPGTGASEAHPFTLSHIGEGIALGLIALVVFVVAKKPLEKVGGKVPDVDAVYNPLAFFGTRGLVVGVTELYAAVDRAAVSLALAAMWTARNPTLALQRGVPQLSTGGPDGDGEAGLELRANIGQSAFLVVATLALALVVLFVTS
ncbi:Na(+)/H(+) antiporter subunit D [Salinibaculum rarum]|uniref:Na(+)/H(+) antiporter subunit D n=1 Tax=Salinibaculum rarum TaxID=3058903 RepID=UPI00265E9283|nr:Na(+)/H(+) antiporter subunit D [Salinibaculum sp. KK48]